MSAARRFRKKPVVIEAMQFTGKGSGYYIAEWMRSSSVGSIPLDSWAEDHMDLETLEGTMTARPGDWIIRGVQGEFYPCKPDIFEATYEPAGDPS